MSEPGPTPPRSSFGPSSTTPTGAPSPPGTPSTSGLRTDVVTATTVGLGVLTALVILAVFRATPTIITAIGVGVVFALALDPVLRAVQRRLHCSRAVGTLVVGAGLSVVFGATVLLLGPQATDQAGRFADELPATIEEFYDWPIVGHRLEDADAVGGVERFVDELPARIDADSITDAANRLISNVVTVLLVLVTAIAVLFDGEALVARVRGMIPPAHRERADDIGRVVYRSMARYFAGSVSIALLNGLVILTAGLILGIPLAPLAGIWAAITNLIPQVGGFLGGAFFVLLAVTQGPLVGVIALVVFLAYQQTENNVIQPLVIGRAVDLSPPTTMLAALIGGAAAGVPGALVATPLLGAAKSVWMSTIGAGGARDADDASSTQAHDASDDRGAPSTALTRLLRRVRPS